MKRFLPYLLLITGIFLTVSSALVLAQDEEEPPEPPEYAGTRDCRDCHGDIARSHRETVHALTMVEVEEDMDEDEYPVLGDFSIDEDLRTITFPDGESRAFTAEDVAFTLGAGRHVQAYLYRVEDEDENEVYYLLPAEWNVSESAWEPLELAESWPDEAYAFGPNCAGCHTVGLDTSDYEWEEEGVMCESCHGPGLDHVEAADDAGGSIDDEERAEIYAAINLAYAAESCGQCHVRGLAEDGIHPYPVGFYPGLTELADTYTLADEADDAHWWASGHAKLPNMQYNEWITSAHPNSLATAQESENFEAACMSCHTVAQQFVDLRMGNEAIDPETIDPLALAAEAPFGVTCASCHDPHMVVDEDEEEEEAAALPHLLRQEGYTLCVSCHTDNDVTAGVHHPVREVFEGLEIVEGIAVEPSPHFSAEDGPTCATCHMPTVPTYNGDRSSHVFQIIAPGTAIDLEGLQDTCTRCHEQGPAAMQQLIDDLQSGTQQRISVAREALSDDTPDWVLTALDVVDHEGSYGVHNFTYTNTLLKNVEQELGFAAEVITEDDLPAEIDAALPDVAPTTLATTDVSDVVAEGLADQSIALLVFAGLVLVVSAFAFFRSN